MILGMGTGTYTLIHVLISLLGIASGLVVLFGLISGKMLAVWNTTFLMSTVATSLTGFGFPFDHFAAVSHSGNHFSSGSFDCYCGTLYPSPGGSVETKVCDLCFDCSLFERVCCYSSSLCKGAGAEASGADSNRDSVCVNAAFGAGNFRLTRNCCDTQNIEFSASIF